MPHSGKFVSLLQSLMMNMMFRFDLDEKWVRLKVMSAFLSK
jgi:hypothetical protein